MQQYCYHNSVKLLMLYYLANTAQLLKTVRHNGNLDKDDTVSMTTEVTLPESQFGDFFILAEVDVYNYVFENIAENNNLGSTQVCNIIHKRNIFQHSYLSLLIYWSTIRRLITALILHLASISMSIHDTLFRCVFSERISYIVLAKLI